MFKKIARVSLVLVMALTLLFGNLTPTFVQSQENDQLRALLIALIIKLQAQLAAQTNVNSACVDLTYNQTLGSKDATTAGQVSKLQKFLKAQGDYTYPTITGTYGPVTRAAVQKFQKRTGIVAAGNAYSTGYGAVGPGTRAKIKAISCAQGVVAPQSPAVPVPPQALPSTALPIVSCAPSVASAMEGSTVTWTASVSGGDGVYAYSWSGTHNLSGNTQTVSKKYNSEGTKTAAVVVDGVTAQCSPNLTITENPALNIDINCSVTDTSINVGESVTWSATYSGGTAPYTFAWSGTDGLTGSGTSVSKTYTSAGTKAATFDVNGVDEDCPDVVVTDPSQIPNQGTPLAWPPVGVQTRQIQMYANALENPGAYQNISSTFMAAAGGGYVAGDLDTYFQAQKAVSYTNQHPAGHKSIYFHNMANYLFKFKDPDTNEYKDFCLDPVTNEPIVLNLNVQDTGAASLPQLAGVDKTNTNKPMQCLFWEDGQEFANEWMKNFITEFKSQGGTLDKAGLDTEMIPPYGAWTFTIIQNRCVANRAQCPVSWCEAIDQDPRGLPPGFPFPDLTNSVCTQSNPAWEDNRYIYDAWLYDRQAQISHDEVYKPIKQAFPNVKMTDYNFNHWDSSYPVPHGLYPAYKAGDGAHVGTHQAPAAYGEFPGGSSAQFSYAGLPSNYDETPFNAFRLHTNYIRAAALSDNAPLGPYIAHQTYPDSPMHTSDMYKEMIIHIGMTNTDYFDFFGNSSSHNLIDKLLGELELMIGYEDTEMLVDDIVDWDQEYVYTGVVVGDYNVWRFTPDVSGNASSVVVNGGNNTLSSDVVLDVDGDTITFAEAYVYPVSNPVSNAGIWIIQKASAGDEPDIALGPGSAPLLASAVEARSGWSNLVGAVSAAFSGILTWVVSWF
jgi:peptidoglycan hydrolase-like protein with peptidoglycan-binding domain